MKRAVLLLLLWASGLAAFAQHKAFDMGLSAGIYFTQVNKPILQSAYAAGEFEYHHTPKWAFAANILLAEYFFQKYELDYFTSQEVPMRRRGSEVQSNFMVKYQLFTYRRVHFQVGAGLGLITSGNELRIDTSGGGMYLIYKSNTDFGFPVQAELYRPITKKIFLGLKGGLFIQPDYPIMAHNLGLQVRYRL
ncbi:hypothetical protein GCM10027275_29130 [Rhabdobacter roseus]|uniref:Outer membrane protein beta-barrel domain-containing protein n=1 Tax=Rhabdobacter roseus TaxID=1655419 RepID=A0A840TNC8_9BACT|nr:hypothetical protein [Rhabdobacter roseus]MBB5284864.1 hypothetical protein [Rhabdobacter roseus]